MDFQTAFEKMKDGYRTRLPNWDGYWTWDAEKETVLIHLKEGEVIDIRETEQVEHTLQNIFSKEWEIVPEKTEQPDRISWWEERGFEPDKFPVLRRGDRGNEVEVLQKALRNNGSDLVVDGIYGSKTERSVKAFQRKSGLVVDGIFGPKTATAIMNGQDSKNSLGEKDIAWAAEYLGVEKAAIKAVSEVESRGNGFFSNGLPAILFERHWMYRFLDRKGSDVESYTKRFPDVVNPQWGGYQGGHREYSRLDKASEIDRDSALKSCSWGAYQIMGFHWRNLGYSSVKDFVERMRKNEGEHLRSFVLFIENDEVLHRALKRLDWEAFARRYNGPAYKRNNYDEKMRKAYKNHR